MPSERSRLEAELAAARAAMRTLRDDLAADDAARRTRRPATVDALAAARRRVAEAEAALLALAAPAGPAEPAALRRSGDDVEGTVRVLLPPGLVRADRARLVAKAVAEVLEPLLRDRDVTLSAAADRFVRERGRDEEGRTLFALHARIEGDFLVPVRPPAPAAGPGGDAPKRKKR